MSCILLIHHDPVQLYLLCTLLQDDHEEILAYVHSHDSFFALESRDDVGGVVLDLQIRDVERRAFHQRVQQIAYDSGRIIPILGLSSHYAETESLQICHEFQLDAYLTLPIDPHRFRQSVQDLVCLSMKRSSRCDVVGSIREYHTEK